MRRRLVALLTLLSLIAGMNLLAAPAASAHPSCGQVWGSQPKSAGATSAGLVVDIRTGRHPCFDRLVLDVDAPLTGWSVQYVDELVDPGSGAVVPVRGRARLEVAALAGVIPTDAFFVGPGTLADTSRFRTFRHVAWVGSSGDVTVVGLGVRARLPFRAFVLPGPGAGSRLVVDVGHRWCAPGHRIC